MDSIPIPHPTGLPAHAEIVIDHREVHEEEEEDDDDDHDPEENDEEALGDHPAPPPAHAATITENGSFALWSKQSRPRGRRARDPDAETVRYDCKDVDDLENYLRDYLEAPTANAEHATIEFHFPVTAAFMVYTRDFKRDSSTNWTSADVNDLMRKTAVSVYEVLTETQNPKDQVVRQKAVGRTIVEAIQRADKFKYSFHNNWLSREDQAHRFSFFCNDSTLNKGRAANGGAGMEGKERRKPVYDCKGLIAVKFSVTKQNLEVHYKHVPIHQTFDERAPLPRRESKRRRLLEVLDPERLKALRLDKQKKLDEERLAAGWAIGKNGRPKKPELEIRKDALTKRRRKSDGPQANIVDEQAIADEGLQPLLDFLGSAERTGKGADGSDDDVIMTDRDGRPQGGRERNGRSKSPLAFPSAKISEMRNTVPRRRPKYLGPLLPGMMEGTLRAGDVDWTVSTPSKPPGTKRRKKRKRGEEPEEDSDKAEETQDRVEETELEQLKRRLHETEQRLLKIEAEKSTPVSIPPQAPPPTAYPPFPYYPYYPYPPPQHLHYPIPAQAQPAPPAPTSGPGPPPAQPQPTRSQASTQSTPTSGPRQPVRWVHQPPPRPVVAVPHNQRQAGENRASEPQTTAQPESIAKRDTAREQPRGETAWISAKTSSIINRTISTPISVQSGTGTNGSAANIATQSQPVTLSKTQAPTQLPPQHPSAPLGNTGPIAPAVVQASPKTSGVQATGDGSRHDLTSQQPSQSSSSANAGSQDLPQQTTGGGTKLDDVRHTQPAASPEKDEDPYLTGLFDNAMAAIMRIQGAAGPKKNGTASAAAMTAAKGFEIMTERQSAQPPTGSLTFKIPNYKPPPRNFYKYGTDADVNKSRAASDKPPVIPTGTTQTPVGAPHLPPQYPYPYAPYQQNYGPLHLGHPPPGYPPYPPPGYPPYPPPPGYGYPHYPPYPPYQYPPALAPHPTETAKQREAREKKAKETQEGPQAWATQLREAMVGYAQGTPSSASRERAEATETRPESAVENNKSQTASDPADRSSDTDQTKEKEVVQIDSDDEDDVEGSANNQVGGREQDGGSTGSKSGSASVASVHEDTSTGS